MFGNLWSFFDKVYGLSGVTNKVVEFIPFFSRNALVAVFNPGRFFAVFVEEAERFFAFDLLADCEGENVDSVVGAVAGEGDFKSGEDGWEVIGGEAGGSDGAGFFIYLAVTTFTFYVYS